MTHRPDTSRWIPRARRLPRRRSRSGVAVFMGLATLMLLLTVSVPYVLTTQYQHASSVSYVERKRAANGARSAADHGIAMMSVMAPGSQFGGWRLDHNIGQPGDDSPYRAYNDPFVDSLDEFHIDIAGDLASDFPGLADPQALGLAWSRRGFSPRDDRSQVWTTRVTDEQGRVNLNTASPNLIGNILGSAIIGEVRGNFSGMTITMAEGGANFPDSAGYFVVEGVLIRYRSKAGQDTFLNCAGMAGYNREELSWLRGSPPVFIEDQPLAEQLVRQGALAIPVAAWLIPWYRMVIATDPAVAAVFTSVDQMRLTANLPFFGDLPKAGAVDPARWLATRELFTVHSHGNSGLGWHFPQLTSSVYGWDARAAGQTVQSVTISPGDVPNPEWLQTGDPRRQNSRGIPTGTLMRVRLPGVGGTATYQQAVSMGNRARHETLVSSLRPLPTAVQDSQDLPIIEAAEPAPININTAPFEVLVANMRGLRQGQNVIGMAEASAVASAIRYVLRDEHTGNRPSIYRRLTDALVPPRIEDIRADQLMWGRLRNDGELGLLLGLLVEDKIIEGWVAGAIMGHQHDHGAPSGMVLAKWSFGSRLAVRVDGVATAYAPIGVDTARAHVREHVSIGSDAPFTWEWLDRHMLVDTHMRPAGNIFALYPGPSSARRAFASLRLPALLDPEAAFARGPAEVGLSGGASFQPPQGAGGRGFVLNAFGFSDRFDNAHTGATVTAGSMSFWHQWPSGARLEGRDSYIFDSGEQLGRNQMSLLWWDFGPFEGSLQSRKPGLTFRIADRTIEQAFVAVSMRPGRNDYVPGQWYHYGLNWQGTELSGIGMMVDGRARLGPKSAAGTSSGGYAEADLIVRNDNGNWASRSSRLLQDVSPTVGSSPTDTIEIEDQVAGFWPSRGVIKIGEEAIEYTVTTARGFAGLSRAARGTPMPDTTYPNGGTYPRGQRVTMFGYSSHVVHDVTAPYLPRGGSDLADALDGNGIYPVGVGNAGPQAGYFAGDLIGPLAGGSKDNGTFPLPVDAGVPRWGVYYVRGPAWTQYVPATADPSQLIPEGSTLRVIGPGQYELTLPPAQSEFIIAERTSNGIRAVRRFDANFAEKTDPQTWYYFMGGPVNSRDTNGDPQPIPDGRITPNQWTMSGSICILCSVAPTPGGDYLNPLNFADIDGVLVQGAIARVQVGLGNAYQDFEWIQYSRLVDAPSGILLAYTVSGTLQARATGAAGTIFTATAAIDPGTSKQAIATLINTPHREISPRSNPQDPLYSAASPRYYRHLTTGSTPITPVFAVKGWVPGVNDKATILQSPNNFAAGGYVRRVGGAQMTRQQPGSPITERTRLMAFDQHHGRMFPAQTTSEVLKFPSGPLALPTGMPPDITFGASRVVNTGGGGRVDEVSCAGYASLHLMVGDPVNTAATRIVVSTNGRYLPLGIGLIKINDEYIAYRRATTVQRDERVYETDTLLPITDPSNFDQHQRRTATYYELSELTRGLFGSRISEHGRWDGVQLIRGITVGSITGTIPIDENLITLTLPDYQTRTIPGGRNIPLFGPRPQPVFDPFGFARVDPGRDAEESTVELFGYNGVRRPQGAMTLVTGGYRGDGSPGLFRGQYGTMPRTWSGAGQNPPVVAQFAVREPDFFPGWMARNMSLAGTPSPEISHIQGGETFRNAMPTRFRWYMSDGGDSNLRNAMRARLYLRFDGAPGWDAVPDLGGGSSRRRPGNAPAGPRLHAFDFDWSGRLVNDYGDPCTVQEIDLTSIVTSPVDRIEWRVVFVYPDGAYANGAWKGTLQFRGAAVDLSNETRILAHEEVK